MTKIAYFDCLCGAAGDMILASMIDAGLDVELLEKSIRSLGLGELDKLEIKQVNKNGIRAVKFTPVIRCEHAHHHHPHRHLDAITQIIQNSGISERAKINAVKIFAGIAAVEGKIHGKPPEQVHFHEIGATDSIVDIVGCCVGFDYFDFDRVYCSTISLGGGTVQCAHGIMPVPAPATAELVKGLPVKDGPVECELLTPTGAAVLAHFVDEFSPMPPCRITATGYGGGTKDFDKTANILRLRIAEPQQQSSSGDRNVWLVETNTDDCTGEIIGFVCEKLMANKALDVWTSPIYMKKNRPGVMLSILCEDGQLENIEEILLSSGITLGLRKIQMQRNILERRFTTKQTPCGEVKIKEGYYKGVKVFSKPEFDCLSELAKKNGVNPSSLQ